MTWRGLLISTMLILLSLSVPLAYAQLPLNAKPFGLWLEEFKAEAIRAGIPGKVAEDALAGIAPDERVVELDQRQPEDKVSFGQYSAGIVSNRRVKEGRQHFKQYEALLQKISAQYHVPPHYIIALWGIETHYGSNKGNFQVIPSLATLAYEGRRAEFFRRELLNALVMLRDQKMLADTLIGSWAGAMGHCQFMPSSYLKYAVDWDGDGHKDIWNSLPDAFASIANYLHQSGWQEDVSWGRQVLPPQDLKLVEADLYAPKPMDYWRKRGVANLDGTPLKGDVKSLYLMYPGTPEEGAWLVTENYHVLLKWNRSRYFASSVGMLADEIAGAE